MYHNILVPLDGSNMSEAVLRHVEGMARQNQAKVILLQVEDGPVMLGRDEVIDTFTYKRRQKKRKQRVKAYLTNLIEQLQESGIDAQYKIRYGSGSG